MYYKLKTNKMKKTIQMMAIIAQFTIGTAVAVNPSKTSTSNMASSMIETSSMHVSKDGMVNWTVGMESNPTPYMVEQYIFDRWVKIGEIKPLGGVTSNSYSYPAVFHSGENKFRIKQKNTDKTVRYSEEITYQSKKSQVCYQVSKDNKHVEFSRETFYIVYNPYGEVIAKGTAESVDISGFEKGNYCLIYDNQLGGFRKKNVILKNTFCPIVL